jgi:hypothetical protein
VQDKLAGGEWDNSKLYPKLSSHSSSINASSLTASPSDFAAFVNDLHNIVVERFGWEGSIINKHFVPMSPKCAINAGLGYDYVLRVERIGIWYPALVNMLGLQDDVKSGWRELYAASTNNADPEVCDYIYIYHRFRPYALQYLHSRRHH